MAAVATPPGLPKARFHLDTDSLSTLRDPRSSAEAFPSPKGGPASSPHPDLNMEVATLSNKLISAINHQTHLDDALAATRQELGSTHERLRILEASNDEYETLLKTGQLVRREEMAMQTSKLTNQLAEEKERRLNIEKEKKRIELELENLTTALFEEANEMVAAARKEREVSERRNEQLRAQLKETESLLASQQEQLSELKGVMSQMQEVRDDAEQATANSTSPSTPAISSQIDIDKALEAIRAASASALEEITPAPPTSFPHLMSPVLRTDLVAFEDFKALLEIPKKSAPSSRVNSGSYGGVNITGLALSASAAAVQYSAQVQQPNAVSQTVVASTSSPPSSTGYMYIPLKETKFYKRALTEDIEPTMRLDTAPGLSWLARRTVINSICDGSLVVEPMPASTGMSVFSCALCGEHRKGPDFTRTHRFRTSENENAQRYPLCSYCLSRVRATCDYIGFLRMIRDGHWRADSPEAEKAAWEESVRLRERMFWARVGGGVIPAFADPRRDSPRPSEDDSKPSTPFSAPPIVHYSKTTPESGYTEGFRKQIEDGDAHRTTLKARARSMSSAINTSPSRRARREVNGAIDHQNGDGDNKIDSNTILHKHGLRSRSESQGDHESLEQVFVSVKRDVKSRSSSFSSSRRVPNSK